MGDDDFASFMEGGAEAPLKKVRRGDQVQGRVVHIGRDCAFVDFGARADGRVALDELRRRDGTLMVAAGDTLEAVVTDPDAPEGPMLAVTLGKGQGLDLDSLQMALETATPVEGRFSRAVKSGLEIDIEGVRAFCPASQLDLQRIDDLESMVGQVVRVEVLEIKNDGRSVIVSRRRVLERERQASADAALSALAPGQDVEGTVRSIKPFGAFVDVGGVEGLVHISELATGHVDHVEDVVSVGEQVRVRVLAIEEGKDGPRVKLSLRALAQESAPPPPEQNQVLEGEVLRLLPHGLVVKTAQGEGVVPVRELALPSGGDHRRAFSVGQTLPVTLLDRQGHKLRFSATKVDEVQAQNDFREYRKQQSAPGGGGMGALASQLGKLNLGELPKGPPPKPKPAPEPKAEAAPAPQASAPAATEPQSRSEAEEPTEPEAPRSGPRRRRIVSGRGGKG